VGFTLAERFWSKVYRSESDKCWNWIGAIDRAGFGYLSRDGKKVAAHRVSYELHNGSIPPGRFVCQTCFNRRCVRPTHLKARTRAENNRIRRQKGRGLGNRGAANANAKISPPERAEIITLFESGLTQAKIAARFKIRQPHVSRIVRGKAWKHLSR
jgi:hypothetical protein